MSPVSETLSSPRGPLVVAGGVFVAFVLSSSVNALIAVLAHMLGAPEDFDPLKPSSYAFLTALGVLAGSVGWALVRRFSRDPERLLRRLVPSVVVLSFVPDFFLFEEGEVTGVVALLAMHVVVAVIAVQAYRRVMPLSSAR
ncbi:DUF6069 family protein [Streptomyces aurantiogriseus]|uniref:Uncharacterized protein n=1 Tax=Streptomyces aurantiogriseus TaxID=66870 RepID=A0A918FJA0_9ACTN|nr:DUF6069 family protein [Streptomyces aurantiogriseus]GGR41562.1 hypothetical protein GCM10010251_67800 [Streptomyces aurantiogriseus]